MRISKLVRWLVFLLAAPAAFACTITISPATITVAAAGTMSFTATPSAGCTGTYSWSSTIGTFSPNNTATTTFTAQSTPTTGTITVTLTKGTNHISGNATVTINATIPATFFGLDINNTTAVGVQSGYSDPWPTQVSTTPTIGFGTFRTLGSGIKWADVVTSCTASGGYSATYNFTKLNEWFGQAQQYGQKVMFTAYYTPDCMVTQSNPVSCAFAAQGQNYGCYLPGDITNTGTGSDARWPGFINDLLSYLSTTNGPTGAKLINQLGFLEVWNEPNNYKECDGTDHGAQNGMAGNGNCTAISLARMTADAWSIVNNGTYSQYKIKIISPAVTGNNPMTDCTQAGNQATINSFLASYLGQSISTWYVNPLSSYVDIVGFHGYVSLPSGSGSDDPASGAICIANLINSVQGVVSSASTAFASKPLYDTEGSWATDSSNGTYLPNTWITGLLNGPNGRETAFSGIYNILQASYNAPLTNAPLCPNNSGVCPMLAGMSWYGWDFPTPSSKNANTPPSTGQYWNETPNAVSGWPAPGLSSAGIAYQYLYQWLNGGDFSPTTTLAAAYTPCSNGGSGTVWQCQFVFPNGKFGLVVWDSSGLCSTSANTCTPTNSSWTVPARPDGGAYTTEETLAGVSTTISAGKVSIGLAPLLVDNR